MSATPNWINAQSLSFDDEFRTFTSSPDGSSGWMTTYPYGGEAARDLTGNHEAEYYSDPSVGENPFSDQNGVLTISAKPAAPGSNPYNLPYDSGLITTDKSFSQLYGYFEVRAQLPAGQGLWPAFWMLPVSGQYTSELDVFEVLGSDPHSLFSTTHGSTNGNWSADSQKLSVADTSSGFHTYGVDWEPTTTTFYMDGQAIASAPTPASMDTPMFMLLNLAVGGAGSWPGAPNASTVFPANMQIDYVRAYASANTHDIAGSAALPAKIPGAAPVITGLAAGTGSITDNATPTLIGSAAAGARITLYDTGGITLGSTVAGANGAWSIAIGTALTNGAHALTATATDVTGLVSAASAALNITIDTTPPAVTAISASIAAGSALATGQSFTLALTTSKPVVVTGTPALALSDGGTASYDAQRSTSTTMVFDATVGASQSTADLRVTGLALNGGTITDIAGNSLPGATVAGASGSNTGLLVNTPALIPPITLGSGPDTVTLWVNEDAYLGDAQFTVAVDGQQVGGVQTTTALRNQGQTQQVTVNGAWGGGTHSVAVDFLNDLYAGTPQTDRNLYVAHASYDGVAYGGSLTLLSSGTQTMTVGTQNRQASPADTLTLNVNEDAWLGDAQFTVAIDGRQISGVQTATALRSAGKTQSFSFSGNFGAGAHTVAVDFLNDAYGGNPTTDRNLYVQSLSFDGRTQSVNAALMSSGTQTFNVPAALAQVAAASQAALADLVPAVPMHATVVAAPALTAASLLATTEPAPKLWVFAAHTP